MNRLTKLLVWGVLAILAVPAVSTTGVQAAVSPLPSAPPGGNLRANAGPSLNPARPSSPPSIPSVTKTLYLVNNTLQGGNGLGINSQQPYAVAYDSHASELFVTDTGTDTVSVVSDRTDTVVATIPVPGSANGIAVDPGNGEVFVSNTVLPCTGGICAPISGNVSVISDATNTLVTSVNDDFGPEGAAYDNDTGELFVANAASNNVSVISASSHRMVAAIPVGKAPWGVAYDSVQQEVFVANWGSNNVSVISTTSNSVVASIPVGTEPVGVAYDPASGEVFVANSGSNSVSVISASSHAVVARIPVESSPLGIADVGSSADIFVANQGSNSISVLASASNTVVTTIRGETEPAWPAYDIGKGEVFTTLLGSGNLSVVSATSDRSVATVPIEASAGMIVNGTGQGELFLGGQNVASPAGVSLCLCALSDTPNNLTSAVPVPHLPNALAYDRGRGEVFATDANSYLVSVVSDTTHLIQSTVNVSGYPNGLAYDPGRGEVFVAVDGVGVKVLSDSTNSVVATVPVGTFPDGVAYDPVQGEVFVANAGSGNVSVISDATDKVVATIPVNGTPYDPLYDSGKGEMFLALGPLPGGPPPPPPGCGTDSVIAISASNDSVVATVGSGSGPFGEMAYDGATGDIIAVDGCSGVVDVYSDATDSLVAVLTVGAGPEGVAYDAADGDVYVTNAGQGTVSILSYGAPIPAPTISAFTAYPPSIPLGQSTELFLSVSGGSGVYGFAYTGLPAGCVSSSKQALVCTPAVTGTFPVRAYVNDTAGHSVSATTTLTVTLGSAPTITSFTASPPSLPLGSTAYLNVTATGGTGTLSFAYAGLPAGCVSSSKQALVCTPAVTGTFPVRAYVNDTAGHSVSATTTLTVTLGSAPTITSFTASPPSLPLGTTTYLNVTATGGIGALNFRYTGLPPGCASSNVDSLSCLPTAAVSVTVRVFVNDTTGKSANATVSLTVTAAASRPAITRFTASPSALSVGGSTYLNVTPSGGVGRLTYAYTGLPAGCLTADVASLTCAPTAPGTFTVRVFVNDSASHSANATTILTVSAAGQPPPPAPTFLNLPGDAGYLLIGVLAATVLGVVLAGVQRQRKRGESRPPSQVYELQPARAWETQPPPPTPGEWGPPGP